MDNTQNPKKLLWYNLTLVGFVSIWGLANVVNNFAQEGMVVIVSWLIILALYFIPYALMVAQLGSTFKTDSGGVSSWIKELTSTKIAYLAAWTYWVVNVTYLAQKSQTLVVAGSWLFQGNGNFVKESSATIVQILTLAIFLIFLYLSSRGITTISRIGTIAGLSMVVMSILFIVLGLSAPALTGAKIATANMNQIGTYIPKFNFAYFTTISMLVFAVGGSDKLSPYVDKMKNAGKNFPKGLIALAILVVISALMGSFAMGIIFDAHNVPDDLMANGVYEAFARLGNFYHLGNSLTIIYAIANVLATAAALIVSIDAPLRILLADSDGKYIPAILRKKNNAGSPINGYKLTGVLVSIIILIPALGIKGTNNLYNWLLNLNSVVMPLRFLWVFLAFMLLNRQLTKFKSDYMFVKNSKIGFGIGLWAFVFTLFACILGMVPKLNMNSDPSGWWFQLILNIITPIFLIGLGFIFPMMARRDQQKMS